ncbi:transposable element Tcb1 transposase [Trichonephila clavipes]|nr:transposable element Tcb1 transposase [Trichonephila clavipes]
MNCLTACQTLFFWPTSLPDLSPIEHVLNMMGRQLHLPENVDDLALRSEQIWQEIPLETIRVRYHFMPRNMAACTQARGWTVKVALFQGYSEDKFASFLRNNAKTLSFYTPLKSHMRAGFPVFCSFPEGKSFRVE